MTTPPDQPAPQPHVPRLRFSIWLKYSRDNWRTVRNPDTLATAQTLAEQFDRWLAGTGPVPETSALIAALRTGGSTVPVWACGVMSIICDAQADPIDYALTVFRASKSPARGWMMRFFDGPKDAGLAMVHVALDDKSARVREWACEGVESHKALNLVPRVEELAQSDPHPAVRSAAARTASMLTRGYHAEQQADGTWMIELSSGSFMTLERFAGETVATLGIDEVVRLFKADPRLFRPDPQSSLLRLDPQRANVITSVTRPS